MIGGGAFSRATLAARIASKWHRAGPLVRAGLAGPALRQMKSGSSAREQADGGVGRGPGGRPHPMTTCSPSYTSAKLPKWAYNVYPLADARGSVLSAACTEPRPSGSGRRLPHLGTKTRVCWWIVAAVCGVLPFQGAARTALEDARDRQDGAALDRSIAELRAVSSNGPPQAFYQLATAYSYAAEVAIEVKDKAKAETLAESGIDAIKSALRLRDSSSEYHRLLGELCGQVIPANPLA